MIHKLWIMIILCGILQNKGYFGDASGIKRPILRFTKIHFYSFIVVTKLFFKHLTETFILDKTFILLEYFYLTLLLYYNFLIFYNSQDNTGFKQNLSFKYRPDKINWSKFLTGLKLVYLKFQFLIFRLNK